MFEALAYVFNPANFSAHGEHFAATPVLFWVEVVANIVTFVSYTLIPIVLWYFVKKRKDLGFQWVFIFFGAFIILCGLHHLFHTITFWYPVYGLETVNDTMMAIVSFGTFVSLIPVIPVALKIPSPKQLADVNAKLLSEIESRKKTEAALKQNEGKLQERNAELQKLNQVMVGREMRMAEMKQELEQYKKS